ncbi:MAG: DUF177 domain-containing protein [Clostridiales bacterium]|jgi:uncharacterized metal-binding protein YceD (DUF177 family)|nr:DUF177 domain-containing protein [Clostridiales bacterium]
MQTSTLAANGKLNISDIMKSEGESRKISCNLADFSTGEWNYSDLFVTGAVRNNAGRIELECDVNAIISGPCSRCSRDFHKNMTAQIDEFLSENEQEPSSEYFYGFAVDLQGLAAEALILATPIAERCEECEKDIDTEGKINGGT